MHPYLFLLVLVISSAAQAQDRLYLKEKIISSEIFMWDGPGFHDVIFDSTLIRTAKISSVSINITDSASYKQYGHKKAKGFRYQENMFFTFSFDGKIYNSSYNLVQPGKNMSLNTTWLYSSPTKLFTITDIHLPRSTAADHLEHSISGRSYSSSGKLLYAKYWRSYNPAAFSLEDTTMVGPFASYYLNLDGMGFYKEISTYAFGQETKLVMKPPLVFHDTITYKYVSETALLYRNILSTDHLTMSFSDSGRPTFYCQIQGGDSVLVKTWEYDTTGLLIHYQNKKEDSPGSVFKCDYYFEWRPDKLPSRIIYREEKNVIVFDFDWTQQSQKSSGN